MRRSRFATSDGMVKVERTDNAADNVAIFVHGISGNAFEVYWGDLITLLQYDSRLSGYDFVFWPYRSTILPIVPVLNRLQYLLADPTEIGITLASFTRVLEEQGQYRRIVLFGHSLGGLICAESLVTLSGLENGRLRAISRHIGIASSPLHASGWARAGSMLLLKQNRQLNYLGSRARIVETWDSFFRVATSLKTETCYFHCDDDAVVRFAPEVNRFNCVRGVSGTHSWCCKLKSRDEAGYQVLQSWLLKGCNGS